MLAAGAAWLLAAPALAQSAGGPGAAPAPQGADIQHDAVGCMVAGEFPTLEACFTPADPSQARAYFKGSGEYWYWVAFRHEATKPAGCYIVTLPRPSKKLREMSYYLEIADPKQGEARTPDKRVDIVPDKGGCKKDVPVAGWVPNASVVVGAPVGAPAVPLGFGGIVGAGGIGAAAVVGGTAAAAVVGGGTAAILSSGGGSSSPTGTPTSAPAQTATATAAPPGTQAPTATPTPVATPTLPPQPFVASLQVRPTRGVEPLRVTFDACASTGTNLRVGFDYDGDGVEDERRTFPSCSVTRTFSLSGVTLAGAAGRDYNAKVTIWEAANEGATQTQTVTIHVDPAGCGAPSSVTMTMPMAGNSVFFPATIEANAGDPDGIAEVRFKAQHGGPPATDVGTATGSGPTYSVVWNGPGGPCIFGQNWDFWAEVVDSCGDVTVSAPVNAPIYTCASFTSEPATDSSASAVSWTSELAVPGGAGLVSMNGNTPELVPAGMAAKHAATKARLNRIDFTLQKGDAGGSWTFALRAPGSWDPASVRVLVGDVVSVTGHSIAFRLKGRPGERVSFTFP
jgi:hypothetical protein